MTVHEATAQPILQVDGITKLFGSLRANDDVSFELQRGEVHAIVGENGAGKTTLMRIVFGLYEPDAGSMYLDGTPVRFDGPIDAIQHGIGMVHQHFMLVPSFTIAENVTLGAEPSHAGRFDMHEAERLVAAELAKIGMMASPQTITGSLNVANQQKLEIAKVLYRGANVIILDEPTAVLTPQETEELFGLLKSLAADGAAVVFISHKLSEVFAVADRITVLRSGKTVGTMTAAETDARQVVTAMTGRHDVNLGRVHRSTQPGASVLELEGIHTAKPEHDAALDNVTCSVRAGEIVGIAGVEGNGQSILGEVLIGSEPVTQGRIALNSADLTRLSVTARRNAGLAYVPEDRHLEGLPINGTVLEGISAGRLRGQRWTSILKRAMSPGVRRWASSVIDRYNIKVSDVRQPCSTLSGGNQQKIIVARELEEQPRCLVLVQPTRGVDLGAIEFIYEQIAAAAENGCAVVLISADLDEILRLSDRILVMYRGAVVASESAESATKEALGAHMMGLGREPAA